MMFRWYHYSYSFFFLFKKSRTLSNSSDDTTDVTNKSNSVHPEHDITSPNVKSFMQRITSAPDVEEPSLFAGIQKPMQAVAVEHVEIFERPSGTFEPVKKRYEKEAWPGRKTKGQQNLLSV